MIELIDVLDVFLPFSLDTVIIPEVSSGRVIRTELYISGRNTLSIYSPEPQLVSMYIPMVGELLVHLPQAIESIIHVPGMSYTRGAG